MAKVSSATDVQLPSHVAHAKLLGEVDLFADLDRVTLAKLASYFEPMTFQAGSALFREGDAGNAFYLVADGKIGLHKYDASRLRDLTVHTLGRGGSVGGVALLANEPRAVSATAEVDSEVLRLDRDRFLALVRREPGVALAMAATLSRRLTKTRAQQGAAGEHPDSAVDGSVRDEPRAAATRALPARGADDASRKPLARRLSGIFAAVMIAAAIILPPPAGLSTESWLALALLLAIVPALALEAIPEGLLALSLAAAWVILGVASPAVALSGFATQSWVLVVAVLIIGAAINSTGILYRLALWTVRHMGRGFAGQVIALSATGLLIGPAVPNATSRVIIVAPMLKELVEALGYPAKSRASVGLSMATLIGFGQMAAAFLTSSTTAILVLAVLPTTTGAGHGWLSWAYYGAPANLMLFLGLVLFIALVYRPPKSASRSNEAASRSLALQQALLGPPAFKEKFSLVVAGALLLGFISQPLHGIHPAWVAVIAVAALAAAGIADTLILRKVNWSFALLFGVLASMAVLFAETGLAQWVTTLVAGKAGALTESPLQFIAILTLLCFALSIVVRWQASAPLMTIALAPVGMSIGVDPFVVGLTAVIACNGFFLPYQSTTYLALYHGTDGQLFSHKQAMPIAVAYVVLSFAALCLSVPIWHAMGLL